MTMAFTKERSVAAPVPRSPPMKSIWSAISFRILCRAGADQQPDADRGLLVMQHGDHAHPVAERADLVGRKRHFVRRQRSGRLLRRPVPRLRASLARKAQSPNPKSQDTK